MENPVKTSLPVLDFEQGFRSLAQMISDMSPALYSALKSTVGFLIGFSIPFSLACLIGIVYCVEQLKRIRQKEHEIYDLKVENAFESADVAMVGDENMSLRWETVKRHIESTNENDWRQAIMEADIMLDHLLDKMGYRGESIGEKLKRVEPSDFDTLNDAWEAHKFRNKLAHEGSTIPINQLEAKNVINMYKKVFEEFYYI